MGLNFPSSKRETTLTCICRSLSRDLAATWRGTPKRSRRTRQRTGSALGVVLPFLFVATASLRVARRFRSKSMPAHFAEKMQPFISHAHRAGRVSKKTAGVMMRTQTAERGESRRRYRRYGSHNKVTLTVPGQILRIRAAILDWSSAGARLHLEGAAHLPRLVRLRKTANGGDPIEIACNVVWQRGRTIGVQFGTG